MIHPDCDAFVQCVETLLDRRRAGLRNPGPAAALQPASDWGPRSWSRTELEDMVYSSYKQMRKGRITRPPRREVVMELADYLECTLEERNRLLLAAGAAPIAPYLTGADLDAALRIATSVAEQLTIPSVIITRDWHIHYFNDRLLELFAVTPQQLAALAPHQFNVLHLLFDPALPLHPHLIQNRSSWTRMARQTIYAFKGANQLNQFDVWYSDVLAQLLALPEFATHWASVAVDQPFAADPSAATQASTLTLEVQLQPAAGPAQKIWLRPLLISVGYFQFDFPQIVAFVPTDPLR
jgi:hypothetical protein